MAICPDWARVAPVSAELHERCEDANVGDTHTVVLAAIIKEC